MPIEFIISPLMVTVHVTIISKINGELLVEAVADQGPRLSYARSASYAAG